MTRLNALVSALAFSPLALAFSNTAPFIAWSSHSSNAIDRLPSVAGDGGSKNLFETILLNDDVCDHEAVVLVHQPGLHASDLRQLSKSSHMARSLSSASSSRQYPYIPESTSTLSSEEPFVFAQSVSEKCHSRLVNIRPGQGGVAAAENENSVVVVVNMPGLDLEGPRKAKVAEYVMLYYLPRLNLFRSRTTLSLYTGFSEDTVSDRPVLDLTAASPAATTSPKPKPKSGILHRYQLLTPGLIMVLLIVLFVFVPVLYFGISALASIQSPLRLDAVPPKGYNANERKNQ
ncbi:hypothetical protein BDP27DRAFT_1375251 [Rhodocollybia butyracea]|uniref:Protein BIG1 n=1 Tax=Rhodocollybia butyracea TaxID=206335 RepID=A0A9P5TX34_9AGAR|nr:hypothetical protein BDP27DRAFT_1375251 [Rhodocollybia butyracea]